MICRRGQLCSLLTAHHTPGGAQGSSQEFPSIDREINVLQYCLFSKHFVRRTSFRDVFFPFWWRSMLYSHLSLGLLLISFHSALTASQHWALTLSSSSLLMTRPNHRSLFLSIAWTMGSILVSMIPPERLTIVHIRSGPIQVVPFAVKSDIAFPCHDLRHQISWHFDLCLGQNGFQL